jgi:hypothetical protein
MQVSRFTPQPAQPAHLQSSSLPRLQPGVAAGSSSAAGHALRAPPPLVPAARLCAALGRRGALLACVALGAGDDVILPKAQAFLKEQGRMK